MYGLRSIPHYYPCSHFRAVVMRLLQVDSDRPIHLSHDKGQDANRPFVHCTISQIFLGVHLLNFNHGAVKIPQLASLASAASHDQSLR
jgi:hypothetical protein